jgi:hypothetical protein
MRKKHVTVEEFDRIFDEGIDDIFDYCDMETLHRPGLGEKSMKDGLVTLGSKELVSATDPNFDIMNDTWWGEED